MPRKLDTATLDGAAQYHAGLWMLDAGKRDRAFVRGQFYDFWFRDEFDYLAKATADALGRAPAADFKAMVDKLSADDPRSDETFARLLDEHLAITPDGDHITGHIGKTQIDSRLIGRHSIEVESPDSIRFRRRHGIPKWAPGADGKPVLQRRETMLKAVKHQWPIYAGEGHERALPGGGVADPLPPGTPGLSVGALVFNMSAGMAILALDALVDGLDAGTSNATIQSRSGAQPADPDAATTGTLAASNAMSATAFGAAADQADGTVQASAAAISDDTSADATVTVGYNRVSSTNDGITPIDDLIDGSAGVGTFDFNWNTVSFVAGATVTISAYTMTLDQGATAT